MPRIVSLIPSATEIVYALGQTKNQVGRSHECDYPPQINQLPICTEAKLRTDVSSKEIDNQVQHIMKNALAVYRVFGDVLKKLNPDVILTQSQCELCAVSLKDVEKVVCDVLDSRPQIVSLEPMQLSDLWTDIRKVAKALKIHAKGEKLITRLQKRITKIETKVAKLPERPKVGMIEWIDPLMSGGNWMPELVEKAGGTPLLAENGKHSPVITIDQLKKADPDVIVVLPCGFDMPRIEKEMTVLQNNPDWHQLRAVQNDKVYIADGNQFFNRPGPRLVESLEILAEILHPKSFHFGHQHINWKPFPSKRLQASA